jgi:phytoene dehydrogenase-like protein
VPSSDDNRAVVIGSGPNGLTAAIVLARTGRKVTVYEQSQTLGGGARSGELTLPGFVHDICSAVHPLAVSSPAFEEFPLASYGLEWIQPPAPVAHPLDDGSAVLLERSLQDTGRNLEPDGERWIRLFKPLIKAWPKLRHDLLAPALRIPRHPLGMARFGLEAFRPASALARSRFRGVRARALFAGMAAHSVMPLEAPLSAAFGLILGAVGHAAGWPLPRGGAQSIANALAGYLVSLGGEVQTASPVTSLPQASLMLCDVTPRQFLALAGARLSEGYRRELARYRYGPGTFKLDWALDGPIPWRAAECARAATVHLGGTLEEIAAWEATHTGRPFVILVQPTLFDASRAPAGKHIAWGYCHVPHGSAVDMTEAIEGQIERFAPGFRARILARHVFTPAALEQHNPNLVGGDLGGGAINLRQFLFRPTPRLYGTPLKGVYLCSSSTPPGGGVHGMCGYHAAKRALRDQG